MKDTKTNFTKRDWVFFILSVLLALLMASNALSESFENALASLVWVIVFSFIAIKYWNKLNKSKKN